MSEEPISERVSRLAGEALSAQARIVRESVEVGRDAWSPGTDPTALSKAWAELAAGEGQRYWQSLATISLDTARELLALNTRTAAALLRGLSEATGPHRYAAPPSADAPDGGPRPGHGSAHPHGASARPDEDGQPAPAAANPGGEATGPNGSAGAAAAPPSAGSVRLGGPSGSTARGSLTVANRHPRARRVTVAAGELRDAATGAASTAVIVVEPGRVTVPAGEERRVELSVELDPAAIRPGRAYAATLTVTGGDEARVDVIVTADPD